MKEKVAGCLKDFDAISARDKNSGEIVRELTGQEPIYNLDPVLMYDFLGKCKEIPTDVLDKEYMLLYGYSGRFSKEECKEIHRYADSKGLKVFFVSVVSRIVATNLLMWIRSQLLLISNMLTV